MRELEDVKAMIVAWKESYYKIAVEDGGGEAMCDELYLDIQELALPYIASLRRFGRISEQEYMDFMLFCREQVDDLRRMIQEAILNLGG